MNLKRFIYSKDLNALKKEKFDVVIIGSGIAGLYTALNIDESLSVAVLSKESSMVCSSWLAQGGIAAVTKPTDDEELHFNDTITAGAGLCDKDAVEVLVKEGPDEIDNLIKMGVLFDKTDQGDFITTKEGGHSKSRVLHSGGDATGKEITQRLAYLAQNKKNLTLHSHIFLVDILKYNEKASGVIVFDNLKNQHRIILSSNIVIATGGIGQVYKSTTNPVIATGDGIAAAARAGAKLENMEFVQFHPTAFADEGKNGQCFLISEAVRGEGGILKNIHGQRFMQDKHPLMELAPRDIVARAIFEEMKKTNSDHVFIDITHKDEQHLKARFPTIYEECKKRGINISKDLIPVAPIEHYMMGGIKTDLNAMTNIDGLYACGESACTGVHGANRLASNSLLECIVFAKRCAKHINSLKRKIESFDLNTIYKPKNLSDCNFDYDNIKKVIKNTMSEKCGIVRKQSDLKAAKKLIDNILRDFESCEVESQNAAETYNIASIAGFILDSAQKRKSSVGAHTIKEN